MNGVGSMNIPLRPLKEEQWQRIESRVLADCPHFQQQLLELVPMSKQQYRVCLLLKLGIKPSQIARLTAHSPEAISSIRRRLYQKATGRNGSPKDWDEIIIRLKC